MFDNLKFSKEPIVYLGALIIVLQTVMDWLPDHSFSDVNWWQNLLVAAGAVVGRKFVTPTAKTEAVHVVPPSE